MTKKETAEMLAMMQTNYPDSFRNLSDEAMNGRINLWFMSFRDDDYKDVLAAVMAHINSDTERFMPPVGVIKAKLADIRAGEQMTELEAWNIVNDALRNSLYNSQKEFDKLPPMIQRLVGSPYQLREWAQMDSDTVSSVIASNFQRSYKSRAAQERELLTLPTAVRQTMEQIAERMKMPELPSDVDLEARKQEQIRRLNECQSAK